MRRLFPHPAATFGVALLWMMLNSFSLGHLLLGCVVGGMAGWSLAKIEPEAPRLRRIWPLVKLFGIVFVDIIRSNAAVAWLILTRGRHGTRRSDFIEIPLRVTHNVQLGLLAIVVTATPGTAWMEYNAERNVLLLHVFDLIDGADWSKIIRDRYETLLLEAYGNDQ